MTETEGTSKIYRASLLWRMNLIGAFLVGSMGALILAAIGILSVVSAAFASLTWFVGLLLAVNSAVGLLLFLPGKLIVSWPIAVEVGSRLTVVAPYSRVSIRWDEIADAYDSWVRQGFVIKLAHRRGLLRYVVVHWFFGPEREALIAAVRQRLRAGDQAR